jgi:excisionase family DNA binding protein
MLHHDSSRTDTRDHGDNGLASDPTATGGEGTRETYEHCEEKPHGSADSDRPERTQVRLLGDNSSSLPLVLSVPQAAAILGISKDLAYDLTARGELPSLRFGRRVVVPTKPLLRLLNSEGGPFFPQRSA